MALLITNKINDEVIVTDIKVEPGSAVEETPMTKRKQL